MNCKKPNTQMLLFYSINDVEQIGFDKIIVLKCLKGRQQMHKHFTFEYVTPSDLKYYLKIAEKTNIIKIIKEDYENKRRT